MGGWTRVRAYSCIAEWPQDLFSPSSFVSICLAPTLAGCTHFLLLRIPEWGHILETAFVLMAADSVPGADWFCRAPWPPHQPQASSLCPQSTARSLVLTHRHPGGEGLLLHWLSFVMDPITVPKTVSLHILTCCRSAQARSESSFLESRS